jgi:hypothetical protein
MNPVLTTVSVDRPQENSSARLAQNATYGLNAREMGIDPEPLAIVDSNSRIPASNRNAAIRMGCGYTLLPRHRHKA